MEASQEKKFFKPEKKSNLRYFSFDSYLKNTYHEKVAKIVLDAGFTCPNRDGSLGSDGCFFCANGSGARPFSSADLLAQYRQSKQSLETKWQFQLTIPYFQAFTNTYGPLSKIQACAFPFLALKEVVGLAFATRPDCLRDEVIRYLDTLCDQKDVWLELGLQSIHQSSADAFGRGYPTEVFFQSIEKLKSTRLKICVHIINGLPGETSEMMMETAKALAALPIHAIKIHMLHICADSVWGKVYQSLSEEQKQQQFPLLTLPQYTQIVCDQLEVLPPGLIIERLTGDGLPGQLLAPLWTRKKFVVLNEIQKELVRRDSFQGKFYG